ncbi:GNAT family N-acetyltransferase [Halostella sp. JP-L12]|uniref:GNAT family N-acetyltransferase n=1 Tax=Halostella TaxID=1843185 RepID=UPI000EF7E08E|nr:MULTISPECIES: GNAT family N-acetyltransferase [Halostella]NHN47000.1 GNAT family N-acetyltransferase [Halostella sp. JP-L12]
MSHADAHDLDVRVVRTDEQYDDALDVRYAVFVDEQDVPEDLEVDEHEDESVHFVAYRDGDPVGAARLREKDDTTAKVERVAVLREYRGEGYGRAIMREVEAVAAARGYDRVALHAQTHAAPFYDRLDYERVGEEFEEAGIPHVTMEKALESEGGPAGE